MKYTTTASTARSWMPALMRRELAALGGIALCRLRKCRRDGACTGPLVRWRAGMLARLAEAEGHRAAVGLEEGDIVLPACSLALPEFLQNAVTMRVEDCIPALVATPGGTILEPTRALAARRWSEGPVEPRLSPGRRTPP